MTHPAPVLTCSCRCHRLREIGEGPPAVNDPVATATACSRCRDRHYPPEAWEPPDKGQPPRLYDPSDDTD